MNRMAKMPEILEPIGRLSVWRKMRSSKVKYMDVYRDATSRLHGYGSVLLLLESPSCMRSISS